MDDKLVTIEKFPPYNKHRMSRPWLAKLMEKSGKLEYDFQNEAFVGDEVNGGELICRLSDGTYLAWGQKDSLGKGTIYWYGVYRDGRLHPMNKADILRELVYLREKAERGETLSKG